MPEEQKLSIGEVRRTISTTLASSFGFVIALVWSNVVLGGLANAGIQLQPAQPNWGGWAVFLVTALVLTVFMILLIIVISRWGSKE